MRALIRSAAAGAAATTLWLAWASTVSAQTPFRNLTPGTSVHADVERALGAPTAPGGTHGSEYRAPEGLQKIIVTYGAAGIVDTIEVVLLQPVTRRALAERFGVAAGTTRTGGGRLIEYFDAPALLSFAYASTDQASGVTSITHFSAGAFASATGTPARPPSPPPAPRPPVAHSGNPDDAPGPRVITHAVSILDAVVIHGDSPTLQVTANDPAGDFTANRRIDPFSYVRTSWRCPAGSGVAMEFLERAERKDATTAVVTTKVSPRALTEGCELRIRIQDDAENLSDWFVVKTVGR